MMMQEWRCSWQASLEELEVFVIGDNRNSPAAATSLVRAEAEVRVEPGQEGLKDLRHIVSSSLLPISRLLVSCNITVMNNIVNLGLTAHLNDTA